MKQTLKVSLLLCVVMSLLLLTGCNEEKKTAIAAYDSECERISEEVANLNTLISDCENLIASAEKPFDPNTMTALEASTADAKASITEIPSCPSNVDEIYALIDNKLNGISYKNEIDSLTSSKKAYEDSIKVFKQVTNPSEAFVMKRIKDVKGIVAYDAVTEDNDPNGNLGKAGGYTAAIYFQYDKVNQDELSGESLIEKGTGAGGQIEVYANTEDAEKRNDYLAAFDGSVLASGSHTVVGTMVVRTSDYLKASEQKKLEARLITALTALTD